MAAAPSGTKTNRVGKYSLHETLGEGAFGKVKLGIDTTTGSEYAIKIMEKTHIEAHGLTLQVRREIAVMKAMRHPNIVNLHEVLNSSKKLYMVMDLVTGGELFDAVAAEGRLGEAKARSYFQQLVDGALYCHSRRVYHRDLKPENLLLSGNKKYLKITDFGLASIKAVNAKSELLHTVMGSPHYIAPEVITSAKDGYDGSKVDAWACGIILYGMLAGALPFDGDGTRALYKAIVHDSVEYPKHFSYDVIKLLRAILHKDPAKRAGLDEVRTYNWFKVDYEPLNDHLEPEDAKRERPRGASSSSSSLLSGGEREAGDRKKRSKAGARKNKKRSSSLQRKGDCSGSIGSAGSSGTLGSVVTSDQAKTGSQAPPSNLPRGTTPNAALPVRTGSKSLSEVTVPSLAVTQLSQLRNTSQPSSVKTEQFDSNIGSSPEAKTKEIVPPLAHVPSGERMTIGGERPTHTAARSSARMSATAASRSSRPGSFSHKESGAPTSPSSSFSSSASTGKQQRSRAGLSIKDMRARMSMRQSQGSTSFPKLPARKSSGLKLQGKNLPSIGRSGGLQNAISGNRGEKDLNEPIVPIVEAADVLEIFPASPRLQKTVASPSKNLESEFGGTSPRPVIDGTLLTENSEIFQRTESNLSATTPRGSRNMELLRSSFVDRLGSISSGSQTQATGAAAMLSPSNGPEESLTSSNGRSMSRHMDVSPSVGSGNRPRSFIRTVSQSLGDIEKNHEDRGGKSKLGAGPSEGEYYRSHEIGEHVRLPSFDSRLSGSSSGGVFQPKAVPGPRATDVSGLSFRTLSKDSKFAFTPLHSTDIGSHSLQPPEHPYKNFAFTQSGIEAGFFNHLKEADGENTSKTPEEAKASHTNLPAENSAGKEVTMASIPSEAAETEDTLTSPMTPEKETAQLFGEAARSLSTNQSALAIDQNTNVSFLRKVGKKSSSRKISKNLTSILFKDATKDGLLSELVEAEVDEEEIISEQPVEDVTEVDDPVTEVTERDLKGGEVGTEDCKDRDPDDMEDVSVGNVDYWEDEEEYVEEEFASEEEEIEAEQEPSECGDEDEWTMGVPQAVLEDLYKQDHDNGYPPWYALDIDVFEDSHEDSCEQSGPDNRPASGTSLVLLAGVGGKSAADMSVSRKLESMLTKTPGAPLCISVRTEKVESAHETSSPSCGQRLAAPGVFCPSEKFMAVPYLKTHKLPAKQKT